MNDIDAHDVLKLIIVHLIAIRNEEILISLVSKAWRESEYSSHVLEH